MSYQDKSIQCSDYATTFTFGDEEEEEFASKGYTNEPNRRPSYREARKAKQVAKGGTSDNNVSSSYNNGSSSYNNRSYSSAPRQMFPVKCATCGKDTQVPFEPRGDRPVYCPDCYRKTNPVKRY